MSGLGDSPIGFSTPFGIGTPDEATAPPTIRPQDARYLDPTTKNYVVRSDGEYERMPRLRQRVVLALATVKGSSTVQPDVGLIVADRIDTSFERRTQFAVRNALAFLVNSGELRIDSIRVTQSEVGRVGITVSYTDLLTGIRDTASV